MTEAEAKTKWCPMARYALDVNGSMAAVNSWTIVNQPEKRSACIGSACMMWRELPPRKFVNGMEVQYGATWSQEAIQTVTQGYCGLAGKP